MFNTFSRIFNYDFIFISELSKRIPDHPFLKKVEGEIEGFSEEKIKLPKKMLSTDKAYSWGEVEKWLERITKFAAEISFSLNDIVIQGTAKLDGFAGYDDGERLYTRGDGNKGSDISRVFERGLGILNDSARGQGPGAGSAGAAGRGGGGAAATFSPRSTWPTVTTTNTASSLPTTRRTDCTA